MTLIDPAIVSDQAVAEEYECEARMLMAQRARLKCRPGTHARQAEMVRDLDRLLDLHNLLTLGR